MHLERLGTIEAVAAAKAELTLRWRGGLITELAIRVQPERAAAHVALARGRVDHQEALVLHGDVGQPTGRHGGPRRPIGARDHRQPLLGVGDPLLRFVAELPIDGPRMSLFAAVKAPMENRPAGVSA